MLEMPTDWKNWSDKELLYQTLSRSLCEKIKQFVWSALSRYPDVPKLTQSFVQETDDVKVQIDVTITIEAKV